MRFIDAAPIALLALAATLTGTAACAAPAVALTPATSHPQDSTRVSGSGFGANEAVDIFYDTTDVLLDVTDISGKFGPDKVSIPANALPGDHWITAIGRNSGDAAHRKFVVSTAWVSHGFNQRGRRRNSYENVLNTVSVPRLDVAWSATAGLGISSSPAVVQLGSNIYSPTIFVGTNNADLFAFDVNGALKWSASTGSGVAVNSPAVASGNVYIGALDGNVYAFKAATGAAAWSSPVHIGGAVGASPAVVGGTLYIGSQSNFFALHASDGGLVWTKAISGGGTFVDSAPAVADGTVFAGTNGKNVYTFHTTDGSAAWPAPFPTGGVIESSPAVAGGVVYIGSEDGKVYAINAKTGTAAWAAPAVTGGPVDSSPAISNGIVFVGSNDGKLYALNANTGATVWTGLTGAAIGVSSPAVANGVVYIGSRDQKLYAFPTSCASTCAPLWSAATGDQIAGSPTVSDGMVFVGSLDHKFYAFALDAGNNAAYRQRNAPAPSYAVLHPDFRLKPVR
jgi:outer membrane protein assembly factor BamB